MKLLFLLLLTLKLLSASTINITDDEINLKNFSINYYDDKSEKLTIETISDKTFITKPSRFSAGIKKSTWIQIPLKNRTDREKRLYITYNNIHILKNITFYTLKDSDIVNKIHYDNYKNLDIENRVGNMLYYEVILAPQEEKTVYINIRVNSQLFFEISISDIKNYSKNIIDTKWLFVFIAGLLIAQGIYYLFLFLLTPYREYFYFSMFIFSVVLWSSYIYGGLAHYFDIYGKDGFTFNSLVFIAPIFTILLYKSIFLTDNRFKKIKLILNILISVLLLLTLIQYISSMGLIEKMSVTRYGPYFYLPQMLILFSISLYMYAKKVPLVGYFLLGYSVSIIGAVIASAFFLGLVPYNNFTFYAHSVSTFFESILFSILLAYRMKTLNLLAQEKDHELKLQDSKMVAMSEVINNIAHQWRQPLSSINALVISTIIKLQQHNIANKTIEEKLDKIMTTTAYMSKTISDFQEVYSDSKEKKIFNVKKLVENTLSIISSSLTNNNINLVLDLNENIDIKNYPNEFQQALLVFINNSKDAMRMNNISNPKIEISLQEKDKNIILKICDNGGGIKEDIIKDIFNPYFTTKHKSEGTGLGLYMSKMIIENSMNGKLYVENIEKGVCFSIELKKTD